MKRIGILYDNISGNIGDQAVGISLMSMLHEMGIEFEELGIGRFNPQDFQTIIIGGGSLLRPSPDYIHDKFRVPGPHILNCCGIGGSPDNLQYLNDYLYLRVRSSGDKRKLSYLTKDVKVVPCTTMLLTDLPDFDWKVYKPSVGVNLGAGVVEEEPLVEYLSSLPFMIYFLPITHYNHDFDYLAKLNQRTKNSFLLPILTPEEIFTLIGRFDYFISGSLHGAIFAYVHGVPFVLFGGPDARKFFLADRGLDDYLFEDFAQLKAAFERLQNNKPIYLESLQRDFRTLADHKKTIRDILPAQHSHPQTDILGSRPEDEVARLKNKLQQTNFQIHYLNLQIDHLQKRSRDYDLQLQQIQHSIPMQLLNRYQRIVEKLLRPGTHRRHYYELILSGIRVILNKGWRSFFRQAKAHLRGKNDRAK
jgi:hypothetical protein